MLGAAPLEREANTTLQMPLTPPSPVYTWSNAFGSLLFTNPTCIVSPPGETNRVFITEKRGRIIVITNLANPTRTVFMDMRAKVAAGADTSFAEELGLLSMAFHPGYATNRQFFVWYTAPTNFQWFDVLARYETTETNANRCLTNSEVRFLAQHDRFSNHNGGDLHFGPADGYLYLSTGDEGSQNGVLGNGQLITNNFFSCLLRIDVDKKPGNLEPNPHPAVQKTNGIAHYSIPIDNPYVHTNFGGSWDGWYNGALYTATSVRSEIWANGLRNPFRFSFSPLDNTLYLGDVGEQAKEEVNIIERGRNYGWNWFEGSDARMTNWPAGGLPATFTNTPPLDEYVQGVANDKYSVIGGYVYVGEKLPHLYGAYIYGEYGQGNVWALRHTGTNVTYFEELFRDDLNGSVPIVAGISTFGVDPSNGDILYGDVQFGTNSRIKRIVAATNSPVGAPIPATLADTGVFTNLATLAVAPGIVNYDLNVPFWSDNAIKTRWFSLPDTNQLITFDRDNNWSFPTGSVWIKHFELELTNGVPASRKRLETRLLVKNENGMYGVTYRWGDSLTNAYLVPDLGTNETFVIDEGGGILRTQVWHYPGRVECLKCHTEQGGWALGFNTAQLNRDFDYSGHVTNQLQALSDAGYFTSPVTNTHTLRALAPANNDAVSLEYRVRSYLAANCVQCHQGIGGQASWDARITTPTASAGIINGSLVDTLGDAENRVIKPGSLTNSALWLRISELGLNHMPPLATSVLDTNNINLVAAWITNGLAGYQSFADWQTHYFGSTNAPDAAATADSDTDNASNYLEYLTETDPTNSAAFWTIGIARSESDVFVTFTQIANRAFEVEYTTNIVPPVAWSPLDSPDNAPFFSVTNALKTVKDTPVRDERYYRVKVSEP